MMRNLFQIFFRQAVQQTPLVNKNLNFPETIEKLGLELQCMPTVPDSLTSVIISRAKMISWLIRVADAECDATISVGGGVVGNLRVQNTPFPSINCVGGTCS